MAVAVAAAATALPTPPRAAGNKNNSKQTNCSYFLLLSSFFVNFTFLVISIYFICNFDLNFFSLPPSTPRGECDAPGAFHLLLFYLFAAMSVFASVCVCVCACLWLCEQCNDLELRSLCIFLRVVFAVVVVVFAFARWAIYWLLAAGRACAAACPV